jgi:hypothetical protein
MVSHRTDPSGPAVDNRLFGHRRLDNGPHIRLALDTFTKENECNRNSSLLTYTVQASVLPPT